MKTVFIPIFQGVEARNILRSDVFKILKGKEIRIVLFVSSGEKKEYFEKEFGGDDIIYEITPSYRPFFLNKIFSLLKFNLINTKTVDLKHRMKFEQDKNFILFGFKLLFNRIFARKIFRKIVRFLDYFLAWDGTYRRYFEKYQPDLVFLAHLFGDDEISFLKEAKRRKIKSIGLITSWDKITGRCMIRLLPDKLVVYNDVVKKEAVRFVDIDSKDIEVVGIPQYDFYFKNKPEERNMFYRGLGIAGDKKIVVFAPSGRERGDADRSLIRMIYHILNSELKRFNVQLVVRFPPNDKVDLDPDLLDMGIIYQRPGYKFSGERGVDWDLDFSDLQGLVNILSYSDMMISLTSSIAIDAALFDKPVINIKFSDLGRYPLMKKPIRYFETEHYSKLINTGGVTVVKDEEDLAYWMKKYLENQSLNSEGRKKMVSQQCWKHDGQAGLRMANFILDFLD
ncbi:MAG: CDP-glycerol glycerophosphotransferase family protein [Minisyncoccia bacterium]